MDTRVTVAIERETERAVLVTDGTRRGWVPRRWLGADGTVAADTLARAATEFDRRQDERRREVCDRAFRDAWHRVPVARETERAVAATLVIRFAGQERETLAWFPKSAIAGGDGIAEIPGWMIRDREQRALEEACPRGHYERHRAAHGERPVLVRGIQTLPAETAEQVAEVPA